MGQQKKNKVLFKPLDFLKRGLKHTVYRIGHMLYPEGGLVCIACKDEIKYDNSGYSLCPDCLDKLPYIEHKQCLQCGSFIYEGIQCKNCLLADPFFDRAISPFSYDKMIRNIVVGYKDGGNSYLYKYIARHLVDFYKGMEIYSHLVTYVPSDGKAIRRRGFDHNKKVAEEFVRLTEMPLVHSLTRVKHTIDQTKVTREKRKENVKGAFKIADGVDTLLLNDKDILLIDDVMTTGATCDECAKVLKANGAKSVVVLTLGRR